MKFQELILLLPCDSLENLSLKRPQQESEELLAGWSGLYHPDLVASTQSLPRWLSGDYPPEDPAGKLIVIPSCCEARVPADWLAKATAAGARLVRNYGNREGLLAAALEDLDPDAPQTDPALARDFLALGFCQFLVELLTRQFRYMSNLDEARFRQHVLEACQAARQEDPNTARQHLRSAFDRLTEAREYFYPVETYLLDLTLVASTTLGQSLRNELGSGRMLNLLVSGRVVEQMAAREPASLELLRQGIETGNVTLVGGEYDEQELPLLEPEEILDQLRRGLDVYQRYLGCRPTIYGRRRFGLTPLLPQILRQLGFVGALHFTLDGGRFPSGNQSKLRWEGLDGTELPSLGRIPFDAAQPDCFLRLPQRLGEGLDLDYASTVVFAHWPGRASPWYSDLGRMAQYGPVLGRFATLKAYFESTQYAGRTERYEADQYGSPYLAQEVEAGEPDPISRWVDRRKQSDRAHRRQAMATMAELAGKRGLPLDPQTRPADELTAALASAVCGGRGRGPDGPGILVANPRSFPWRECLDISSWNRQPALSAPVVDAAEKGPCKQVLLEVPGMGFAWTGPGDPDRPPEDRKSAGKKKQQPPMAEPNVLRNEYFEATISPTTGGIQAIHNYAVRANRLAQQIAMRLIPPRRSSEMIEPGAEEEYSVMAADEVTVEQSGPLVGRIVSRGRLLDHEGQRLARFVQTAEARRGSRILEIRIELDVERPPGPNPWTSYYAARFAWTDETAQTYRSVGWARQLTEASHLEAPLFFHIRAPRSRMTILPGGLPYHRRFGLRKLDTLLVVRGETARAFRLGIGVDFAHPAAAAMGFLAGRLESTASGRPPTGPCAWLFHVDVRSVLATHWEPVRVDGRPAGFRVRLLETEGRRGPVGLRTFRTLASARKLDLLGQTVAELPVQGDCVTMDLAPYEWIYLEVELAD
ncbi:MAG: hypothetical protein ACUVUC_11400 [Thermoguttaceae bacterium]